MTYEECHWISELSRDVMVKHFIMNHLMRLAIYNEFVALKLLSVAETRFASAIVMLKRFKLIKYHVQAMVISEKWSFYREDDVYKVRFVKEKVIDACWWDKIEYILSFTTLIYEILRACDTDEPCLHLIYDRWNTMMEKVRKAIYRHEEK